MKYNKKSQAPVLSPFFFPHASGKINCTSDRELVFRIHHYFRFDLPTLSCFNFNESLKYSIGAQFALSGLKNTGIYWISC